MSADADTASPSIAAAYASNSNSSRKRPGGGEQPASSSSKGGSASSGPHPFFNPATYKRQRLNVSPGAPDSTPGNSSSGGSAMADPPSTAAACSVSPFSNGVNKSLTPNNKPAAVKKLTIKNFNVKPVAPEDYYNKTWARLEDAVHAVHQSRPVTASLEELYQAVENVCHSSPEAAGRLYECLRQVCDGHLRQQLQALQTGGEQTAWLKRLDDVWSSHCQHMIMIRSIFLYLDRTYVLQKSTVMSIWDVGLELFRSIIMAEASVEQLTVDGLLQLIKAERLGEHVDRTLIKCLVKMLCSLQIYQQMFEARFLDESAKLYAEEGNKLVEEMDVPTYLSHIERRLSEEQARLNYYLDFSTRKPLIHCVEQHLIQTHVHAILDKGLVSLLAENRLEELSLLYQLFSRVKDALLPLKQQFANYVKAHGRSLVENPERDRTLVQDVMDFKAQMDGVVVGCFGQSEKFEQTEKDAFDAFINTRANKPAELIAKFMDSKLRSGNKEATEEELDHLMDKVIVLFRFIQGKDVFEAFYKKDLAKRLLLQRSASVDAEKSMLSKLKQECGAGFTCKLEGMFKDMELSRELDLAFKDYRRSSQVSDKLAWPQLDLTVNILTMGHWPTYPPVDVNLPPAMTEYQEVFKKFYLGKHSGRKLQWQATLGQCVLRATFQPAVVKELQVSLFQTLVLLLFNDRDTWTLADMKTATNMDGLELKRTLQSLACGKFRPITKSPKGKEIADEDVFTFNPACNDRLFRIRISQVQMKETEEEQAATTEQVFQDRQYQIDAAVVRIMKARKSLTHNALIGELFRQLRFPTKAGDLKKRIESLIDRDYLCRDKTDNNTYNYVA